MRSIARHRFVSLWWNGLLMSKSTSKSLRAAPPRRFENYVLTRSTAASVNLSSIDDPKFLPCSPGSAELSSADPGAGYVNDAISTPINIGFDFSFDGITYKKFVACTNGWMALVDPTSATFLSSEVLSDSAWINSGIRPTFTKAHVLLAPWFDDLRNAASDTTQITTFSVAKNTRIIKGLEAHPLYLNPTQYGVKYFTDVRSLGGRRLIVRWTSLSDFSNPSTLLRFECIIYENGKIEFRYAPRQAINLTTQAGAAEDATIGIFMPNGTNRFRDFSPGLGYRDFARTLFNLGGAVSSSYSDTADAHTVGYTVNLKPYIHWPGLDAAGAMFSFIPPSNRRRVLPRKDIRESDSTISLPTVRRTGDERVGGGTWSFDDRRSPVYRTASGSSGGVVVNYPTTLQRFFGDSEPDIVGRQDLFSNGIEITGSTVKHALDEFLNVKMKRSIEPFNEHKRFEQSPVGSTDPFFMTGSSLESTGLGFQSSLRSKTQIKITLPVNINCSMPTTTSSIYYYNKRASCWNVPQASSYIIGTSSTTNNSGFARGDMQSPVNDAANYRVLEDARGFGPIGNLICSGNHTRNGAFDQSNPNIATVFSQEALAVALTSEYPKTITVNESYKATDDELIRLPISQPFLIEKAVIEVPFAAGDGWFKDLTTSFSPIETLAGSNSAFDFAGPGVTFALFNQTNFDAARSRRDLILTGVATHRLDDRSEIVFSTFPPLTAAYHIRPVGFRAYNATPAAIITPASSSANGYTFTGSITMNCEAQIANGVILRLYNGETGEETSFVRSASIDFFHTKELSLYRNASIGSSRKISFASINNMGRGNTGSEPSGRSIFGKEFSTYTFDNSRGKIANPFYLTGSNPVTLAGFPPQFLQAINAGDTFRFQAAIPLESKIPSPYLVRPGDTLIFAVSKMRPYFYSTQAASPYTSGSIVHDVQLLSGAINITLYGSLVADSHEFHDTLNQPLSSDAVHEIVVGNEPVLDQFETNYFDCYSSGTYDSYMAGNMISTVLKPNGSLGFVTGTVQGYVSGAFRSIGGRSRIFTKTSARFAPTPGTSEDDFNKSLSFRLQPYSEKSGILRVNQSFDNTERYWDSLMPGINECFSADGSAIVINNDGTDDGAVEGKIDQSSKIGYIRFNFNVDPSHYIIDDPISINNNWTFAYPFEPRYSRVARQLKIEKSFTANYKIVDSGAITTVRIPTRALKGFYFGPTGTTLPAVPAIESTKLANHEVTASNGDWARSFEYYLVDTDVGGTKSIDGYQVTSSAGISDSLKALYGFGDLNNIVRSRHQATSGTLMNGCNHFADFRLQKGDEKIEGNSNWWGFSPIIRGWKHGVISAFPTYTRAYFRQGRYGQFRDMLEQRQYSKFYQTFDKGTKFFGSRPGQRDGVVTVKFVDSSGKITKPENTWSSNLSMESTSSVPFFDGESKNRPTVNTTTLNASLVAINSNPFNLFSL